jgi:transcription-repair coupling factor (superfamily II helicase)
MALVRYVEAQGTFAKVRPDMRVVFIRDFETLEARLAGVLEIMRELARIAKKKG